MSHVCSECKKSCQKDNYCVDCETCYKHCDKVYVSKEHEKCRKCGAVHHEMFVFWDSCMDCKENYHGVSMTGIKG